MAQIIFGSREYSFKVKQTPLIKSLHTHTHTHIYFNMGFPGAQMIKNLPSKQEIWVQSLDWEDPPEKGKATHSSILA